MAAGLLGYTIRRLLWAVPVLFAVSVIVFMILRAAPGDPVDALLGQRYTEQTAEAVRRKYGYDDPIPIQYWKYMKNLAQGDLGLSTQHQDFTIDCWKSLDGSLCLLDLFVQSRLFAGAFGN